MRPPAAASAAMTDEVLMRRVQADDDRAFELLYDRHRNRVWRLAELLCQPPDAAETVVEDAFVAIWRKRETFDPGCETLQACTVRLVHRRAVDPHRQDQRAERLPTNQSGTPGVGGAQDDEPAGAKGLRGLLDRLPAEQREIIALAFYGRLSHAQIAELLALPPGAVKGRMRLGLHKLRRVMDEGHAHGDPPA